MIRTGGETKQLRFEDHQRRLLNWINVGNYGKYYSGKG